MNAAKPYSISKQEVWTAYQRVKANDGTSGVDGETIKEFAQKEEDNLYKLWNRMSSGSYFPSPVRAHGIAKRDGGERVLGIPTVADRIAQTVVVQRLEKRIDAIFHADSYGYRPGKSAHQALGQARQRCWRYNWVLDMDIEKFFDTIDHALLMRAVERHVSDRWIILYIERWLKAPMRTADGHLTERTRGTPQGGVISPLLANLFLHYAFDLWMDRQYPDVPFERYADDVIVHCETEGEAETLRTAIAGRLRECGLTLHPGKTKIVYCKDSNRKETHAHTSFTFLGYTFRPRKARSKSGKYFTSFIPAMSKDSDAEKRAEVRTWKLPQRSGSTLADLAREFNPVIRGWINYFGMFYRSAMQGWMSQIDSAIVRWAMKKYKRLRKRHGRAWGFLKRMKRMQPALFAHWIAADRTGSLAGAV
jgi:RNA-directed DNA polymerase